MAPARRASSTSKITVSKAVLSATFEPLPPLIAALYIPAAKSKTASCAVFLLDNHNTFNRIPRPKKTQKALKRFRNVDFNQLHSRTELTRE